MPPPRANKAEPALALDNQNAKGLNEEDVSLTFLINLADVMSE